MTTDTAAPAAVPSLSETVLVMDIVDTIRHDDRMRDLEMSEPEARKALAAHVKQAYAAQGVQVSDADIERAMADKDRERYAHKTMKPGLGSMAATLYVRKARYGRNLAAAVAVIAVGGFAVGWTRYEFIEKPRAERAAQLRLQVEETLPKQLASSVEVARGYATRLNDTATLGEIEGRRLAVTAALAAKDVQTAMGGINAIQAIGFDLRKKDSVARLVAEVDAITGPALPKATEDAARQSLGDLAAGLRGMALADDEDNLPKAEQRFRDAVDYIATPYTIRIVDRPGINAGFRMTDDQTGTKAWYIVVEAVSPTGTVHPLAISDRQTHATKTVSAWAIRTTEQELASVAADKHADGSIDDNVAGTKPAGALSITWKVPAFDGQTLNTFKYQPPRR